MRHRVHAGTHPDLTWVRPTGAHVMRRSDVAQAVVDAAGRTPFESSRRVFVLERVDALNDEAANSLLKTLEEPASFVHLILLTDSLGPGHGHRGLALPAGALRPAAAGPHRPGAGGRGGARPRARWRARAWRWATASARGCWPATRARACWQTPRRWCARRWCRTTTAPAASRGAGCWRVPRLRREQAEAEVAAERDARLEGEPKGRERTALERQFEETAKREGRRARTEVLDLGLTLVALTLRDLICLAEGAPEAALDRRPRPAPGRRGRRPSATRAGCAWPPSAASRPAWR